METEYSSLLSSIAKSTVGSPPDVGEDLLSISILPKLAPHAAGGCRRARVVHGKYVTVGYGALPAVVVLSLLATARAGI